MSAASLTMECGILAVVGGFDDNGIRPVGVEAVGGVVGKGIWLVCIKLVSGVADATGDEQQQLQKALAFDSVVAVYVVVVALWTVPRTRAAERTPRYQCDMDDYR